jgi:arylformamidase
MKIYDITRELLSAEVYPGDTAPKLVRVATEEEGGFNTSDITACLHNGTHIDAPLHVKEGSASATEIPLDACYGRCAVITVDGKIDLKKVADIKKSGYKRILFRNAEITPTAAFELSFLKLAVVGTELSSIGGKNVHGSFLKHGTMVLEGLDLSSVKDGEYTLCAFPLKIRGADGSPVRAVLIEE